MREIDFQILWRRMIGLVDGQARILVRSAFSPAVSDMKDFAVTLHDRSGRMLVQSRDTGTISILTAHVRGIPHFLDRFPSAVMERGDAFISNDPWLFAGHKHDVIVVSPLFRGSRLVAFAASGLHVADIGGLGLTAAATDTYQEGLHIPPTQLVRAGSPDQALLDLIRVNVRQPDLVVGDILGQVAANEFMQDALDGLMTEYDLDDLDEIGARVFSVSEARLRDEIRALPDGSFRHEAWMDGMGEPLRIAAEVRIDGDAFHVDFSGSSPQLDSGINCPLNVTYAWAAHAARAALIPDVPNSDACYRPITVSAPEGSFLNPVFPAPVAARHMVQNLLASTIAGALSQVVPDRVVAECGHQTTIALEGRREDGQPFSFWWITNAGMGAGQGHDGLSGRSYPLSLPTIPVEIIEWAAPIQVLHKHLVPDSAGQGESVGGLDQEIAFTVRSPHPFTISAMLERQVFPARGLRGGSDGQVGHFLVDGEPADPKGRFPVPAGSVVTASSGGGGGFGAPGDRPASDVATDVRDGRLSPSVAAQFYPQWKEDN